MKSIARKILIAFGCITLITLSVVPVPASADREAYAACMGNPGASDASCRQYLTATEQTNTGVKTLPTDESSWLGTALVTAISPLLFMVMRTVSGLLGLAGLLLDSVIKITIVDMSANIKAITAINDVWGKIRDLGNMSFIFILLYHGIRMVLGLGSADVKKVITGIIIAAIFVNFSLLVTKVVIDASNIVTLGFYNSISSAGGATSVGGTTYNFGFSGAFMKPLGLSGIWDTEGFKTIATVKGDASYLVLYIGGTIFMLIALFVFLTVGLLFVIRYMVFIVLLIMSPVAFLTFAVPGLGGLSKKYWDTLLGQALFGPIYMLMTWVTLSIAGSDGFLNQKNSFGTALANPNQDTVSVIINFIILIGLLIMSIVLAKTHATAGGIASSKYVDKGQAYLGGAIFGGASYLGRSTLGRAGQSWAENDDLKRRAAEGGKWARFQLLAGNKLASSSFDARNTKTVEMATGDIGGLGKIGSFGKPINTKGYKGYVEEKLKAQEKEDKARNEQFKMSDEEKKKYEDGLKEYEKTDKEEGLKKEHLTALTQQIKADKDAIGVTPLETAINNLEKVVKENQEKDKKINAEIDRLEKKLARIIIPPEGDKSISEAERKKRVEERDATINTIDVKEKEHEALETILRDTQAELEKENKKLDVIKKTDDYKEILKKEEGFKTDEKEWISSNYEELISLAGGKKDSKNQRIKAIQTENNKRIGAYADRLATKTGWLNGYPNLRIDRDYGKRRAAAIRKLIKAETKEAKALKVLKESLADEKEEEAPKKEEPAAATPPPTTTP